MKGVLLKRSRQGPLSRWQERIFVLEGTTFKYKKSENDSFTTLDLRDLEAPLKSEDDTLEIALRFTTRSVLRVRAKTGNDFAAWKRNLLHVSDGIELMRSKIVRQEMAATTPEERKSLASKIARCGHHAVLAVPPYLVAPVEALADTLVETGLSARTEGIFRTCGSSSVVDKLVKAVFFASDPVKLAHDIVSGEWFSNVEYGVEEAALYASALKQIIRSLPETVFTRPLVSEFLQLGSPTPSRSTCFRIRSLLAKIPQTNRRVLVRAALLCLDITDNFEQTKMDAKNLGVCLGAALLTSFSDSDERASNVNSLNMDGIQDMICHLCAFGRLLGDANKKSFADALDDYLPFEETGEIVDALLLEDDKLFSLALSQGLSVALESPELALTVPEKTPSTDEEKQTKQANLVLIATTQSVEEEAQLKSAEEPKAESKEAAVANVEPEVAVTDETAEHEKRRGSVISRALRRLSSFSFKSKSETSDVADHEIPRPKNDEDTVYTVNEEIVQSEHLYAANETPRANVEAEAEAPTPKESAAVEMNQPAPSPKDTTNQEMPSSVQVDHLRISPQVARRYSVPVSSERDKAEATVAVLVEPEATVASFVTVPTRAPKTTEKQPAQPLLSVIAEKPRASLRSAASMASTVKLQAESLKRVSTSSERRDTADFLQPRRSSLSVIEVEPEATLATQSLSARIAAPHAFTIRDDQQESEPEVAQTKVKKEEQKKHKHKREEYEKEEAEESEFEVFEQTPLKQRRVQAELQSQVEELRAKLLETQLREQKLEDLLDSSQKALQDHIRVSDQRRLSVQDEYHGRVEYLQARLKQTEKTLTDTEKQQAALKSELHEVQRLLAEERAQRRRDQGLIHSLQQEAALYKKQIKDHLKHEAESERESRSDLQAQIESLEAERHAIQERFLVESRRRAKAEKDLARTSRELLLLKEKVKSTTSEERLERDVASLEEELAASADLDFVSTEERKKRRAERTAQAKKSRQSEKEKVERRLLESRVSELQKQVEFLMNKEHSRLREVSTMRARNSLLRTERSELQTKLRQSAEEAKALREECAKARRKQQATSDELDRLHEVYSHPSVLSVSPHSKSSPDVSLGRRKQRQQRSPSAAKHKPQAFRSFRSPSDPPSPTYKEVEDELESVRRNLSNKLSAKLARLKAIESRLGTRHFRREVILNAQLLTATVGTSGRKRHQTRPVFSHPSYRQPYRIGERHPSFSTPLNPLDDSACDLDLPSVTV